MAEVNTQTNQENAFFVSDKNILANLNASAVEQTCKELGISTNDSINQFVANAMFSDGNGMLNQNEMDKMELAKGEYEMGIVFELADMKSPFDVPSTDSDRLNGEQGQNAEKVNNASTSALKGINEYFKWFAGIKDGREQFAADDLVFFIPEYKGTKLVTKNGKIVGLDDRKANTILNVYTKYTSIKKEELDKAKTTFKNVIKDPNAPLRIGFKVGYTFAE